MINNLDLIKDFLEFPDSDTFYYLQVLQRKKDNPDQSWQSRQRYFRFIKSKDDLERYTSEAIEISNHYNARTYISLTPRSFEKLSLEVLVELSKRIKLKDFSSTPKLFEKLALREECIKKLGKLWLLDYDSQPGKITDFLALLTEKRVKFRELIPTPSGYHIIVNPFNLQIFGEKLDADYNYKLPEGFEFGLKFDCNTVLYYEGKK